MQLNFKFDSIRTPFGGWKDEIETEKISYENFICQNETHKILPVLWVNWKSLQLRMQQKPSEFKKLKKYRKRVFPFALTNKCDRTMKLCLYKPGNRVNQSSIKTFKFTAKKFY